jgi:ribosomal protein L44E
MGARSEYVTVCKECGNKSKIYKLRRRLIGLDVYEDKSILEIERYCPKCLRTTKHYVIVPDDDFHKIFL